MLPSTRDHPALALLPEVPTEEQIEAFAQRVLEAEGREGLPAGSSTRHICNSDVYGRSMTIPKDTFLVGAPHLRPGIAICVGDITVWTAQGRQRLTGAHVISTQPGGMRVGFAHEDTTWVTVHANLTGEIHIDAIEQTLVATPERLLTRRHPDALGMPGFAQERLP